MKQIKNEELQSRRQFFKQAGGRALPFLAFAAFGGTLLTSCEKDEPENKHNGGGGSSSGCGNSCSGDCDSGCTNNCDSLCGGDCWSYCESKARR